jgi:PhnB protein
MVLAWTAALSPPAMAGSPLSETRSVIGGSSTPDLGVSRRSSDRLSNVRRAAQSTSEGAEVPSNLNPYISFRDNARQAMAFYQDVFGGNLTLNTFGEYGDPNAPGADNIMHAQLQTDNGFTLMASDTPPEMGEVSPAGNITISLSGDDEQELRGYWDKLSEGGTVTMPFEKQMWGDLFGMCTDRFGVPWMVDVVQPQS